jgi:hypothetical protein
MSATRSKTTSREPRFASVMAVDAKSPAVLSATSAADGLINAASNEVGRSLPILLECDGFNDSVDNAQHSWEFAWPEVVAPNIRSRIDGRIDSAVHVARPDRLIDGRRRGLATLLERVRGRVTWLYQGGATAQKIRMS